MGAYLPCTMPLVLHANPKQLASYHNFLTSVDLLLFYPPILSSVPTNLNHFQAPKRAFSTVTGDDVGLKKEKDDICIHVDELKLGIVHELKLRKTGDPIISIAAACGCILVARQSGSLLHLSTNLSLDLNYNLSFIPLTMSINSTATRCVMIDKAGIAKLFDIS